MNGSFDELKEYRRRLLDRYASQPSNLKEAVGRFGAERLHEPLEPGEWSAHQVLAHVWAVEKHALHPRLHLIAEQEDPFLEFWDEVAWMKNDYKPGASTEEMLKEIGELHQDAIELLGDASPEIWSRTGRHPERGTKTLQWWLEYSVEHTEDHLGQLGWVR